MVNHSGPRAVEQERLAAVHELGLLDTPPEERFDRVVRLAQQLFGVPTAYVSLVDRDRLFYKAKVGLDLLEAPRDTSFCRLTIEDGGTLVVEDASADPRFTTNPWVVDDPGLRFYAGHPLAAGGHRVGTLCLVDNRAREFGPADRALLRDLAAWVEEELAVVEELERASHVQAGLLPAASPRLAGWDVAGACLPARGVGGDFYDWAPTPTGVTVSIADVMGKGMGAAIIAATVRAVLRAASRRGQVEDAVAAAEEALASDLTQTATFATLLHAHVEAATGEVTYVDAGHGLSAVVRADGAVERLLADGPPLGFLLDVTPGDAGRGAQRLTLGHGDLLLAVSDGVVDALGGDVAVVDDVAAAAVGAASAADAVERVLALAARSGARPDDITVVVVRRQDAA